MLDENVAGSVRKKLEGLGYECEFVKDLIPEGSPDPLVAFLAEGSNAVLVSHDGDFRTISPKIPNGQKTRFKRLSRIQLKCKETNAAKLLEAAMSLIEHEYKIAQNSRDNRMIITIGESYIRSER